MQWMIALSALFSAGKISAAEKDVPDFNFPQDVISKASTEIKNALKADNGELLVDAIVRYSIAQSSISEDNMDLIVDRIEEVANKEKRPEYRALLHHFEAVVFKAYKDRTPNGRDEVWDEDEDESVIGKEKAKNQASRYAAWSTSKLQEHIDELVRLSLVDKDALMAMKVTEQSRIINCNKLGASYLPSLYQFIVYHSRDLVSNDYATQLTSELIAVSQDDAAAHLFILAEELYVHYSGSTYEQLALELYNQYRTQPESAIALMRLTGDKHYAALCDYVTRFPKSIYAPNIKNNIAHIERTETRINYQQYISPTDSLKVNCTVRNVNDFKLLVFRENEDVASPDYKGKDKLTDKQVTLISTHTCHQEGMVPFSESCVAMLPPLPYGKYIIVPSYEHKGNSVTTDIEKNDELVVTDIASYSMTTDENTPISLIAVNAHSGKPLPGVIFINDAGKETKPTDANGITYGDKRTVRDYINVRAVCGEDKYGPYLSHYTNISSDHLRFGADIFTDLAIYRPGETVQYSAIIYRTDATTRKVVKDTPVTVKFSDANNKEVGEQTLRSDEYGRIHGEFVIPTDRLNGTFGLRLEYIGGRAFHSVEVSEYKTPTFYVELPAYKAYKADHPVVIEGKAITYTGLPVGNSQVKLSVARRKWQWTWWRCCPIMRQDETFVDTVVTSAADGTFTLQIDDEQLVERKDTGRPCYYNYVVKAQVTNVAGESQEASGGFHIGNRSELRITRYSSDHLNTTPWHVPVTYNDTEDDNRVITCTYTVHHANDFSEKSGLVGGTFRTDNPVINLTSLPDGEYRVSIKGEGIEEKVAAHVTLYKMTSKALPDGSTKPLWIPEDGRRVDEKNVAHITIGTGAPTSHIYYVAYGRKDIIAKGWITYKPGMHDFTVKIPDVAEEYLRVKFVSIYESQSYNQEITLYSPINERRLTIKATSFRDKLTPGDHEKWTFKLLGKGDKPQRGAMMLEMIDKAINDIAPNSWWFAPHFNGLTPVSIRLLSLAGFNSNSAFWRAKSLDEGASRYRLPELNLYGEDLFPYHYYGARLGATAGNHIMYKRSQVDYLAAAPMVADVEEMAVDSGAGAIGGDSEDEVQVDENQLNNVQLRMADVKTALWLPSLTTDENGDVAVEFEAPQFNTTWLVQVIGYDTTLVTSRYVAEVMTRKPIMVKASLPRFVRHGDKVQLAATLQNATDVVTTADAMIELFDPRTGETYAARKFNETLAAQGMNALTIDWVVPDTIPYLGFRVRAANSTFGDGEQVMLPVLEAVQPIIESQPFFLNPGDGTGTLRLPKIPEGARVTLEYSDNPVWYCVTALPGIMNDESHLSTAVAHNIFALAVASGIAKRQPIIKEAFNYWRDSSTKDSTLVSQLSRNRDLKIGSLQASPWLRNDERETMRMEKLAELMNDSTATSLMTKFVTSLISLQQPDGGFTWYEYPGCKSSLWATNIVLELLGEVKKLGYAPNDARLEQSITRALAYYDKEYVTLSKKNENKNDIYSTYAYVRSLYPDVKLGKDADKLIKSTVKRMSKKWGAHKLEQGEKAFWAMTLHRTGQHKEALRIIESIRQFAINKPELGTYWDNYGHRAWFSPHQVAVTSTVLQAMAEVDPRTAELDQVRKWMLLSKQTGDWGSGSLAADAVQTLLSSGSDWLQRGTRPAITIDDKPLELTDFDAFVGYTRATIEANEASTITITTDDTHPAWGAVYSQWTQPMNTIEAAGIDEISILKQVNVYTGNGKISHRDVLHVGDKVQVRLVITANREIDYVTVNDERAACFEPVDRFSGYTYEDGSYYYRETKDAQTNMFFDRLYKGTHVYTYDCYVTAPGTFSLGMATAQSQQAAEMTAHSAGELITVEPQESNN